MFEISETLMPQVTEVLINLAQVSLQIFLIVIAGFITIRLLRIAMNRLETALIKAGERTEHVPGAARQRVQTLQGVLGTIAVVMIWLIVILMSLAQIGINIGPILAGAGVLGLAVGFGAQNLVRDLVSGFFLILENQIRVGDVAMINGTGGLVERITFRTVTLRDQGAIVHTFPNGTIQTLSNLTKEWSAYLMNIGVAYKEDTDRVVEVMRRVAEELRAEPQYGSVMLEPLEIIGVDDFADSAVIIKARFKTQPIKQWFVGREYRRRLKKAFDAEGIEIPFPHRTIYTGEACKPFPLVMPEAQGTLQARN
jgi:moderate conductance mechanosensitive channel